MDNIFWMDNWWGYFQVTWSLINSLWLDVGFEWSWKPLFLAHSMLVIQHPRKSSPCQSHPNSIRFSTFVVLKKEKKIDDYYKNLVYKYFTSEISDISTTVTNFWFLYYIYIHVHLTFHMHCVCIQMKKTLKRHTYYIFESFIANMAYLERNTCITLMLWRQALQFG